MQKLLCQNTVFLIYCICKSYISLKESDISFFNFGVWELWEQKSFRQVRLIYHQMQEIPLHWHDRETFRQWRVHIWTRKENLSGKITMKKNAGCLTNLNWELPEMSETYSWTKQSSSGWFYIYIKKRFSSHHAPPI